VALVLIAFDGSPASEHAIRQAGPVLTPHQALVVTVWKEGVGFEAVEAPTTAAGFPLVPIDVRTAIEIEQEVQEQAQRLARHGTQLAQEAGFEAEGLAVADDVDMPVAETLIDVAKKRDAQAIVAGSHGHGRLTELLGTTTRDLIRRSPKPVVVVRERPDER
jgi:nucleotide-binding universal stress UspA family protein